MPHRAVKPADRGLARIDPALHERWLRMFLRRVSPVVFGFVVAAWAAFVLTGDPSVGVTGVGLTAYAACLLGASWLLGRDHALAAATLAAGGLVPASIAELVAWPTLAPVMAVVPLIAFSLLLPLVSERQARLLGGSVLAWTVVVAVIAHLVPPDDELPGWFEGPFLVAALVTAVGMVLLLLFQFGSRMRGLLAQSVASEEALRAANERSRSVLDSALDAIVTMDAGGRITGWSPAAEEIFGFSATEVVGRDLADTIIPPPVRADHRAGLERYLSSGVGPLLGHRTEVVGRTKDGREIHVELSIAVVPIDGATTFSAFVRDISDRRELEEIRRRSASELVQGQDDARRRIAESIHDDPVQHMTVVRMRLHALRSRLRDPEQLAAVQTLDESVDRALRRLRHLMFELHPRELETGDVGQALQVFMAGLEDRLGGDGVLISIDDSVSGSLSERDRRVLYRIAQEALEAARGRADVRTIATTLTEDRGGTLLQVIDDGVGGAPRDDAMQSMISRAELAGGWCRTEGSREGTTVTAWIPADVAAGMAEGARGRG